MRAPYGPVRRTGRLSPRGAGTAVAAGLILAIAGHAGHPAGPAGPPPAAAAPDPVAAGPANVVLGARLAAARGWGTGPQWQCLDQLWTRESGWLATARNPRSGAYGIAQALGHGPTNQYPAGPANPPVSDPAAQITWGLSYIAARYATPCAAWGHELADGWY